MIKRKLIVKTIFLVINIFFLAYVSFFTEVNNVNKNNVIIIVFLIILTIFILVANILMNLYELNYKKVFDAFDIITFITNVLTILLIFSTFIFFRAIVEGRSMLPTLKEGNRVLVKRNDLDIKNEDIVVYFDGSIYIVKRVYAIEGDLVEIKDNNLYVNNIKLIDKNDVLYHLFANSKLYKELEKSNFKYVVRENEYLLLGDNADNSTDSRDKGFIKKDQLIGKAIWWF